MAAEEIGLMEVEERAKVTLFCGPITAFALLQFRLHFVMSFGGYSDHARGSISSFNNMNDRLTRSSTRKLKDVDSRDVGIAPPPAKRARIKQPVKAVEANTTGHKDEYQFEVMRTPLPSNAVASSQHEAGPENGTVVLHEETGDIFAAPPLAVLIHACNCEGSWGAGIALAFRKRYPAAFTQYTDHCASHKYTLLGKAFLIPPDPLAVETKRHFVGCLFTSKSKGKKVDPPVKILASTGAAMRDLMSQMRDWNDGHSDAKVAEVRMCKINSGLFRVPWEQTKSELEKIEVGELDHKIVKVVSLEQ
nr:adp-ribose 1''-phosphate phosphatase [Quercus suber]